METIIQKMIFDLVEIPSVSGNNEETDRALDYVIELMNGFTVDEYEHNGVRSIVVHNQSPGTKKFKILLNGHLDVVPAAASQFIPSRKQDKLSGRGTYDMKAGVVMLAQAFKTQATEVDYPLALSLVVDEEIGGFNGAKFQVDSGITADFVIVGEPSNMDLNIKTKGVLWVELSAQGAAGHAAYPWEATNPNHALVDGISKLFKRYPPPDEETWATSVSVTKLSGGGDATNQIPEHATAMLDIRYVAGDTDFDTQTKEQVAQNIQKIVGKNMTATICMYESPQQTDTNDPYFKRLEQTITEHQGARPQHTVFHGATDLRFFDKAGMSGVVFGPSGGLMHGENEWVSLTSVVACTQILIDFLGRQPNDIQVHS